MKQIKTLAFAAALMPAILLAQSSTTNAPRQKIDVVLPTTTTVVAIEEAQPAVPASAKAVEVFAEAMAKASEADAPKIIAEALAKASEADAKEILAAVYEQLVKMTAPELQPAELVKITTEWYKKIKAVNGSMAWWILQQAKQKAEAGEDVTKLKKLFDKAMTEWLNQE